MAQTENGKQIGLPYSVSVPVLYYNPDIFKAAGLDPANPPKTWAEVTAAAKQIKDKTGNVGFFMQEYADNWAQQAIIESNGGHMLKKVDGKIKAGFDSPEAAQAYQVLADMVKAGWEFIKYLESPAALTTWSTGTGYLPPRKGMDKGENGFKKIIDNNKNIQVALSRMPDVVKWASFPGANGLQAEQLLIDVRDIILSGKQSAADALHLTAEKTNKLL